MSESERVLAVKDETFEATVLEYGLDPRYWPGWTCECGRRNRARRQRCKACRRPRFNEREESA